MANGIREYLKYAHIQSFIGGAILSILTYIVVGLTGDKTLASTASIVAGIMSFLISERQFVSDRFDKAEKMIIDNVRNRVFVKRFDDHFDAIQYIINNAGSCKKIINTRFRPPTSLNLAGPLRKKISAQDAAIVQAIRSGCEYELVCDVNCLSELKDYEPLHPLGADDNTKGHVVLFVLDTKSLPIIQITILIYKDERKEALVGWNIGGNKTSDMPILLFRDNENSSVCTFYKHLSKIPSGRKTNR